MGQKNFLSWEDCKPELERIVNQRSDEYNESFKKARMVEAEIKFKEIQSLNPDITKEEAEKFVKDYVDQAPDEFMRNLRTMSHSLGAVFNQLNRVIGEIIDFKEVYMAVNEPKIVKYAQRHKEEILRQQEEMKKENK